MDNKEEENHSYRIQRRSASDSFQPRKQWNEIKMRFISCYSRKEDIHDTTSKRKQFMENSVKQSILSMMIVVLSSITLLILADFHTNSYLRNQWSGNTPPLYGAATNNIVRDDSGDDSTLLNGKAIFQVIRITGGNENNTTVPTEAHSHHNHHHQIEWDSFVKPILLEVCTAIVFHVIDVHGIGKLSAMLFSNNKKRKLLTRLSHLLHNLKGVGSKRRQVRGFRLFVPGGGGNSSPIWKTIKKTAGKIRTLYKNRSRLSVASEFTNYIGDDNMMKSKSVSDDDRHHPDSEKEREKRI